MVYNGIKVGNIISRKIGDNMEEYGVFLLEVYRNGLLQIEWLKRGQVLQIDDSVQFDSVNKRDFINYTFRIVKIVRNLLLEKDCLDIKDEDLRIAKEIAERESENKESLYLKSISLIDTYNSVDYDVLCHYKEKVCTLKSAVIKFNYNKDNGDDTNSIKMEISKNDLNKLITNLNEILEQLD